MVSKLITGSFTGREGEGVSWELARLLDAQLGPDVDPIAFSEYIRLVEAIDYMRTPQYHRRDVCTSDYRAESSWHTYRYCIELMTHLILVVSKWEESGKKDAAIEYLSNQLHGLVFRSRGVMKPGNDEPIRKCFNRLDLDDCSSTTEVVRPYS